VKKLGLVMVLAGAGAVIAGCDVGVRETDEESSPPAVQGSPTPGVEGGPGDAPAGDYPGPCPVGTWQLSGIEPAGGIGVGAGELSFSGGGSMMLELAGDGTWTVNDDGSNPVDATLDAGGAEASGTATIEGSAEGTYAGQGDSYFFQDDRSNGTVELNAPGYSETLSMEDVLVAIVPTGQATVTCQGNTLVIDGGQARWELSYTGGGSSSDGTSGSTEESGEIREITESGTYGCADESVRITEVAGLAVELTGDCFTVYIDSTGNDVEIESASTLIVGGAANTVDIQRVDEIEVAGALSNVSWHGDEPRISNSAAGATVQEG
jgi:hypothetical protein